MIVREKSVLEQISHIIFSWWWVIGFVSICFFSYAHASKRKVDAYEKLYQRYDALVKQKDNIQRLYGDLTQQIHSQSDPLWIELVLMKGLGLVPEGQKKILFREDLSEPSL